MLRVAVNLDRTIGVALDQDRNRASGKRESRGEIYGLAKHQVFRSLDVRVNRLVRLLGASCQASQGHRGAHHLHEAAPRNWIDPLGAMLRKLLAKRRLKLRRPGQL